MLSAHMTPGKGPGMFPLARFRMEPDKYQAALATPQVSRARAPAGACRSLREGAPVRWRAASVATPQNALALARFAALATALMPTAPTWR